MFWSKKLEFGIEKHLPEKSWWSCDEGRLRGMVNMNGQVKRVAKLAK